MLGESSARVGPSLEASTCFLTLSLDDLEVTGGKIICECHEILSTYYVMNFVLIYRRNPLI